MQTKNIIAVELSRARNKINFELFELDMQEVCKLSGKARKADIDNIPKRSLGFIAVQSAQWLFENWDICKNPKFEKHYLTRVEAYLSVYSANSVDINELKKMRPKPFWVIDNQVQDWQSVIPPIVYKAVKSANSHYRIVFTHLFMSAAEDCALFDIYTPFLLTSEIYTTERAANSALLQTNLI